MAGEAIAADVAMRTFQKHISTMLIQGDKFQYINDPDEGVQGFDIMGGTWDYAVKAKHMLTNQTIDRETPNWEVTLFNVDGKHTRVSTFDLKGSKTFLFEIKTLSPEASASSLVMNIKKGLTQAINNGKLNASSYSILMVDKQAYEKMWNGATPTQQAEIRSLFSQLTSKGGALWLINELEARAKELANSTHKEIKKGTTNEGANP